MHEDRTRRRVVYIVPSGRDEIIDCLRVAQLAHHMVRSMATIWLIEAEHPQERTVAFDPPGWPLMKRWLGTALDHVYPFDDYLASRGNP
jgi:hypothetical protein